MYSRPLAAVEAGDEVVGLDGLVNLIGPSFADSFDKLAKPELAHRGHKGNLLNTSIFSVFCVIYLVGKDIFRYISF
jgi:hypothetical protein